MARALLRSLGVGFSRPFQQVHGIRFFSTGGSSGSGWGGQQHGNSHESIEDFENRLFGPGWNKQWNSNPNDYANRSRRGNFGQQIGPGELDDLDDRITTMFDRMDGELKEAAAYFEYDDDDEFDQEDYSFRPDVNFQDEGTYDLKDLDLTKPGVSKPLNRDEFEVTTEEVLRKADFRNVRFLANFITEAGIIIKRSKTGISAKAQRKVAREIKTARAFGLMPFTTMGTKSFAFGKTMEALERDYEYDAMDEHADENPRDVYH